MAKAARIKKETEGNPKKKEKLVAKKPKLAKKEVEKSLETWLWDAACAIRGAQEAAKFKDYILPLVFVKRLCDVFDDEVNKLTADFGSRKLVLKLLGKDRKLVRFYLPFQPKDVENDSIWDVIKLMRATSTKSLGQQLTDLLHDIARENPRLNRIVNRIDYNNTTHGVREIADDRIEILINRLSTKRLGLNDVEPDVIGRSYEYLIRKFAEGAGQSAGEFYSPTEVGLIMARLLDPEPGMTCYDPTIGSAGLVIKLQLALQEKAKRNGWTKYEPLKMYGQEYLPLTWAMANMNMVIHEMEGQIEIGDTMKVPKLLKSNKKGLMQFKRITANPMWNQDVFTKDDYEKDEYNRFGNRIPPASSADWGWMQHIFASLDNNGRAAVILDTGAASRGSGSDGKSAEKDIRKWFVDNDLIEGVIYLPDNLFYNTTAPGVVIFINRNKPAHLKDKLILVNAVRCFTKGNPKNYIDEISQELIQNAYQHFFINPNPQMLSIAIGEGKGGAALINIEDVEKNDYNISPVKYISNGSQEALLPVADLLVQLKEIQLDAYHASSEVNQVLASIKLTNTGTFKETELGKMPEDWGVIKLDDVCKFASGGTPSRENKEYYKGDIAWIKSGELNDNYIDDTEEKITEEAVDNSSAKVFPAGTLLMAMYGATAGKTSITKINAATNQAICAIFPDGERLSKLFLRYYLMFHRQYILDQRHGGAQPNISQTIIKNILSIQPELIEQESIAHVLISLQEAIQKQEELVQTMQQLFKSLLNDLMTGAIRVNDLDFQSVLSTANAVEASC